MKLKPVDCVPLFLFCCLYLSLATGPVSPTPCTTLPSFFSALAPCRTIPVECRACFQLCRDAYAQSRQHCHSPSAAGYGRYWSVLASRVQGRITAKDRTKCLSMPRRETGCRCASVSGFSIPRFECPLRMSRSQKRKGWVVRHAELADWARSENRVNANPGLAGQKYNRLSSV